MRSCRRVLLLSVPLLFSLQIAVAVGAENSGNSWPKWRGQNQDGKSSQEGVFRFQDGYGLKILWKKTLGSGYSSVSVANQHAVTMFSDGGDDYVIALDTHSGKELWRYRIDATYLGHDNSHDGPIATPLVDDKLVFALGRKGQLLALILENGRPVWSRDLRRDFGSLQPHHGFASSPLVYRDVLLVQTGGKKGKSVAALSKQTGEILWTKEGENIGYQSPIVIHLDGEDQIVCLGNQTVFGVKPESGKVLWSYVHDQGRSAYAILVGQNQLLLTGKTPDSVLIQIQSEAGAYKVEEVWRTRGIKQTYSLAIPHEGHIYGFSNRFLTCIDAKTGKTVWKSRPPGAGFLIFVDGHFVILTREGTLHVSEVSSEGYVEKASLRIFDPFAWTPPSFAHGRIYARSLEEIACIEMAKVDPGVLVSKRGEAIAAKSRFADFVEKVEEASDKDHLIDEFVSAQKQFPIIENARLVHVVYRGEVNDLAIRGDMLDSGKEVAMNRIAGTDLYYYSFPLESDARINYQLVRDLEETITDPLNPRKVPSSRGELSEVAMPEWKPPKHLREPEGRPRGRMETIQFESQVLGNSRTIQIYLPSGYSEGHGRYPTVYVNFGREAIEWAKMPNTLDNLVGKRISPLIAVFVHSNPEDRSKEYVGSLRDEYARMLAEELVPYVDQNYRTQASFESRAIMGPSQGGFISLYSAFKHPGLFGFVGGQSTFLRHEQGKELRNLVETAGKLAIRFYLDWGKYDERVLEYGHTNRIRSNRALAKLLTDREHVLTAVEVNEGYGWASWRNRTDRILETFFPLKKTSP